MVEYLGDYMKVLEFWNLVRSLFLWIRTQKKKPEKTVDSRNNKGFWEEFLCIKFHPGFLKAF